MSETRLPNVQWAQRSEKLYLTIDLQEATNTKIELDNGEEGGKVSFSGSACSHAAGKEEHNYALEGFCRTVVTTLDPKDVPQPPTFPDGTNSTWDPLYNCLELYGKIDKAESKTAVGARSIVLVIAKAEAGFWPRLMRASGKSPRNVTVDWNRWVDEDEEEEKGDFDLSGIQNMQNYGMGDGGGTPGGMPGMGGMGGMPGMGGGGGGSGGMPDMAEMMKNMGGMGAGGSPDMQEMLKKMGGAGGMGGAGMGGAESDSDDDVPPLESE